MLSCSKEEPAKKVVKKNIDMRTLVLNCLRWMERDVYFATSDPFNTSRNNQFHKDFVKDVLKELEKNTILGEDYFRFRELNADQLDPVQSTVTPREQIRSFILIWPDSQFDEFIDTYKPGGSTLMTMPDKNSITITNTSYQRKFYMILRASCFEGSQDSRCKDTGPSGMGIGGRTALINRQIALLTRLSPVNCNTSEATRRNVLCTKPSNDQWGKVEKEQFFTALDSQLSTIENNINFFNDAEHVSKCLSKPWLDRDIYPGCYETAEGIKNEPYAISQVIETLNEIASMSMLKKSAVLQMCNKNDFTECTDAPNCHTDIEEPERVGRFICKENYFNKKQCVSEKNISFELEEGGPVEDKSHLVVWNTNKFNGFVNDVSSGVADPNAFSIINASWKSKFKMVFRYSCFDTNNEDCDGGNGGITTAGTKALIGRQLGILMGITPSTCVNQHLDEDDDGVDDEGFPYPQSTDVMCSELPSDAQWRLENRGSLYRYINRLNNYLELIGNNPDFYKQVFEEIE